MMRCKLHIDTDNKCFVVYDGFCYTMLNVLFTGRSMEEIKNKLNIFLDALSLKMGTYYLHKEEGNISIMNDMQKYLNELKRRNASDFNLYFHVGYGMHVSFKMIHEAFYNYTF